MWQKDRIIIALLLIPLAILPILTIYLVSSTPKSLLLETFAELSVADNESRYIEKVRSAISALNTIANQTQQLGLESMTSGNKISEVRLKLSQLSDQLQAERSQLDDVEIPAKFTEAHAHLIAATDHMQDSLRILAASFEIFEEINNGLPLYFVSSFLGGDEPTLRAFYQITLMDDDEQIQIENARRLFNESVSKASLVKDEIDTFVSTSGIDFSTPSIDFSKSAASYARLPGRCAACDTPVDIILNYSKID